MDLEKDSKPSEILLEGGADTELAAPQITKAEFIEKYKDLMHDEEDSDDDYGSRSILRNGKSTIYHREFQSSKEMMLFSRMYSRFKFKKGSSSFD